MSGAPLEFSGHISSAAHIPSAVRWMPLNPTFPSITVSFRMALKLGSSRNPFQCLRVPIIPFAASSTVRVQGLLNAYGPCFVELCTLCSFCSRDHNRRLGGDWHWALNIDLVHDGMGDIIRSTWTFFIRKRRFAAEVIRIEHWQGLRIRPSRSGPAHSLIAQLILGDATCTEKRIIFGQAKGYLSNHTRQGACPQPMRYFLFHTKYRRTDKP